MSQLSELGKKMAGATTSSLTLVVGLIYVPFMLAGMLLDAAFGDRYRRWRHIRAVERGDVLPGPYTSQAAKDDVADLIDRALGNLEPPLEPGQWQAFVNGTSNFEGPRTPESERALGVIRALLEWYAPTDWSGTPEDEKGKKALAIFADRLRRGEG